MADHTKKKKTSVKAHTRRVPVSDRNPSGIIRVRKHDRIIQGPRLSKADLLLILRALLTENFLRPTPDNLGYRSGTAYDDQIGAWTHYFNKAFPPTPPESPLDPDLVKALIASESGFVADPQKNSKALGIAQITRQTLKTLLDPLGESRDFTFKQISLKDLKDPQIAIPMAVRWLFQKKVLATKRLGRAPTTDELILQYKGLLGSTSDYQKSALGNFQKHFDRLKRQKKADR